MKISNRSVITICLLVLVFFYGIGLGWGIPSEFAPGTDVDFPLGPMIFIGQYSDAASASTYPAFHYLLTLPFYAVVMGISKLSGSLGDISSSWPYGFSNIVLTFSIMLIISRLISMAMGIGILLALWLGRPTPEQKWPYLLAIGLLALSGPFAYYSREANLDIPYIFWLTLSIIFVWRILFLPDASRKNLMLAGFFSALAVATKDQAAGIVIGLGIVIFLFASDDEVTNWNVRLRNAFIFGITLIVTYAIVAILPQPFRWIHHVSVKLPLVRVSYVEYPATLAGQIDLFFGAISDLIADVSLIGFALLIPGFYLTIKKQQWKLLAITLIPIAIYYIAVIANTLQVRERYMIPVAILLIPIIAAGANQIIKTLNNSRQNAGFVFAVLSLCYQFATGYLPITYMQVFDIKRQFSNSIENHLQPGTAVIWNQGRIEDLPLPSFYMNYRLMLPPGEEPTLKSVEHIFTPYTPDAHCLLSTKPLDSTEKNLILISSWEYPSWTINNFTKSVLNQFFLYDIDGQCQSSS